MKHGPRLKEAQEGLFNRVIGRTHVTPDCIGHAHRIGAYADGYFSRLYDLLKDTYAKTAFFTSTDVFIALCENYISSHVSSEYNVNLYGKGFESFLRNEPITRTLPWLADLAKLEWLVQVSFNANDAETESQSPLTSLTEDVLEKARLFFKASCQPVSSDWPLLELWNLASEKKSLTEGLPEVRLNPVFVVAYRVDDQVYFKELTKTQYDVLIKLKDGLTLGAALEKSVDLLPEDLQALFQFFTSSKVVESIHV